MKKIFFILVLTIAVIVFLQNILWRTFFSSTSLGNDKKWSYLTKNASILEMLQPIASSSLINRISKTFESRWFTKAENCQGSLEDTMDSIFHLKNIQCSKLFSADKEFMNYTLNLIKRTNWTMLSNEYYIKLTTDCPRFKQSRGYVTCKLTQEEEDFPIAYSLIIYKDVEMVERLLRAIYRPQNYYCIHVDKKSDQNFLIAVSAIAKCFENVFIATDRLAVHWGTYTVLEPELVCMQKLWRFRKWKYFINLTGQEFPLRTNWELVQILKSYRGANDLEGTIKRINHDRWPNDPPHNITAIKGSVHIAVNRDFVDYILHHQTAKDLLDWVKNTSFPDETFFSTLNHNPQLGIRGTYKGVPETDNDDSMIKPFLTRFKNWGQKPCAGHWVRAICILSTGDLPLLGRAKHMFANKFYLGEDPIVIGCLEEMIYNNTRDRMSRVKVFNSTYYSQLGFVLNKVT